ncbi:hypothetical protein MALL_0248 [Mycoplasmopsis alligatoris A21JP2]|uniref:Lipoprotein n=1 Tax=Mycoplasmopsis alligatoris A21JP2 TaxID=747682 RepID=D4XX15_9BACT|nr:hypothetical protein MALL_0248 [Mycoplasmopsis alligatoris A21JP2]
MKKRVILTLSTMSFLPVVAVVSCSNGSNTTTKPNTKQITQTQMQMQILQHLTQTQEIQTQTLEQLIQIQVNQQKLKKITLMMIM